MTDETVSKAEQASRNWESVVQGDPESNSWGFFSYGDAPGGIGGGVGTFVWFPTRDEMLSFIADTLPYEPGGSGNADWQAVASQTAAVTDQLKSKAMDDQAGVEQLNQILKTFSQIEWMGTKEELLSGNHHYANEVRSAFWDSKGEDESPEKPIGKDEEQDFYEFLAHWGF